MSSEVAAAPLRTALWQRAVTARVAMRHPALIIVLIGLCLYALDIVIGRYTTFFEADSAVKYLAVWSIVHHWASAAITYPLASLDPHGRFILPTTAWYNGNEYAGYSLPFEYLAAACFALLGGAGLALPSVLGTALLLIAQLQLAELLGIRSRTLLLIMTVAATPVLFYALNLWEHSLGIAFLICGTAVLLREVMHPTESSTLKAQRSTTLWRWKPVDEHAPAAHRRGRASNGDAASYYRFVLAGLFFLGGGLMRRETLIAAAVVLVVCAALNPEPPIWLQLGLAGLVMALPVWLILHFHPQPLALGLTHASPGRAPVGVPARPVGALHKLEWLTSGGYATALFVGLSVTVGLVAIRRPRWLVPCITLGSLLAATVYTIHFFAHFSWSNDNPLSFTPLAIWAVWSPVLLYVQPSGQPAPGTLWVWSSRNVQRKVQLAILAIVGIGAVAVMYEASEYGGGQWGPRYILFVFPLLMLLALKAREQLQVRARTTFDRRLIGYSFIILLAFSVGLQGVSLVALSSLKSEWAAAQATVAALPERVIVSPLNSTLGNLDVLNGRKTLLYAQTARDRHALFALLRRHGVARLAYVCAARSKCHWPQEEGWRAGHAARRGQVVVRVYTNRS